MPLFVKNSDVIKSDVQLTQKPSNPIEKDAEAKPPKRGAYDRIKVGLKVMGIGRFEFERERDDRA